ncbi:MAG: 16S rRNA (adenine(1518)-N(6)/adenine(1519)-N(6))-dimethyltransferase RsmA [Chlamydiales bacterium]
MNLFELKAFFKLLKAHPKKRLSQNFLIDKNIVQKILSEALIVQGDYVLEIGSGLGILTKALVNQKADVVGVEIDSLFAPVLEQFPITVYYEDILVFPLSRLKRKGKVIGNLPYHITKPILTRLVPRKDCFTSLTIMVQEEVARRLTASPGTKDYGSLTVFLNFYSDLRYAFRVKRSSFYPIPKVDSAVVTLILKDPPNVNQEFFFRLVRTVFSQRRKMIKNTLRLLYDEEKVIKGLKEAKINPKARPEELSLKEFLSLFHALE